MVTGFNIGKDIMRNIVVMLLVVVLAGCGTINERVREGSTGQTFASVSYDKKELSNAWLALYTFGVYPLFHIVSMPIDLGVDLALYPVDKYQEVQFTKKYNTARAPFQFIDAVGVNLTSYKDFKFKTVLLNEQVPYHTNTTVFTAKNSASFSWQETTNIALRKGTINKLQVNWTVNTEDPFGYSDNPYKLYSDDWHKWQQQYKQANTFNHQVELAIPSITGDVKQQLLVLLFLPCDRLVTVVEPITSYYAIKDFQLVEKLQSRTDYQSLIALQKANKCPVQ